MKSWLDSDYKGEIVAMERRKLQREFKRFLADADPTYYCAFCGTYTSDILHGICGQCDSKATKITKLSDLLRCSALRYRKPSAPKPTR
jgi:Zn finger protein HypA/HybF involved in hydrogenase expression